MKGKLVCAHHNYLCLYLFFVLGTSFHLHPVLLTCKESKLLSRLLLNSSLFSISSICFCSPLNLNCMYTNGSDVLIKHWFCKRCWLNLSLLLQRCSLCSCLLIKYLIRKLPTTEEWPHRNVNKPRELLKAVTFSFVKLVTEDFSAEIWSMALLSCLLRTAISRFLFSIPPCKVKKQHKYNA